MGRVCLGDYFRIIERWERARVGPTVGKAVRITSLLNNNS